MDAIAQFHYTAGVDVEGVNVVNAPRRMLATANFTATSNALQAALFAGRSTRLDISVVTSAPALDVFPGGAWKSFERARSVGLGKGGAAR